MYEQEKNVLIRSPSLVLLFVNYYYYYIKAFPLNVQKGKTFTTLIDFYLVSPNVEILEVKTIDLDFKYSDHQPISLKVKLK